METAICVRLSQLIGKVLEAADYGDWGAVRQCLHNLTHKDFSGMDFHFDLSVLTVQDPEIAKKEIRSFLEKVTNIPDERILFTEAV